MNPTVALILAGGAVLAVIAWQILGIGKAAMLDDAARDRRVDS